METLSNDNTYAVGTTITAKVNPSLPLIIAKYYQRIYYCAVVGNPDHKHFAYFERELNQPDTTDKAINQYLTSNRIGLLSLILIPLKEVIDNMYRLLLHPPALQLRFTVYV